MLIGRSFMGGSFMGGSFTAPLDPALATYRAALGARGTTPLDIVCIGDSVTEGQQASTVDARWIEQLADLLGTSYEPSQTTGRYYPTVFGGTFTNPANRISLGGSGSTLDGAYGLGRRSVDMFASGSGTASITWTGTGAKILYTQDASLGDFTWAVDGGAATTVHTNTAPLTAGKIVTISGLSEASHTLVIAATVGGVIIEGVLVCDGNDASGIRLWDCGHGGFKTSDYTNGSFQHWLDDIEAIQPQLVPICLGINDYSGGTNSAATVKANLQTIIASVRARVTVDPSILLIAPYQAHVPVVVESWATYVAKIKEVADEDGTIAYLDLVPSFGGYIDPPGGGLIDGDRVHPSDTGYALIASLVKSRMGL